MRGEGKQGLKMSNGRFMFLWELIPFFTNDQLGKTLSRYNYFVVSSMCFLKTFKQLDAIPFEKSTQTDDSDFNDSSRPEHENMSYPFRCESKPLFFSPQQEALVGLVSLLNSNSQSLTSLGKKLNNSQAQLDRFFEQLDHPHFQDSQPLANSELPFEKVAETNDESRTSEDHLKRSQNTLVEQLFGKKKYNYKLRLVDQMPQTIFKERNINLGVELTTMEGEKVRNSNIVHMCLAVVDAKGEWITQNKAKENFMKGKTEVELYHGEGSFLKVYPREVSRGYPTGKLNFLIYPKPSVLRFTSNNSCLEQEVDCNLIEPLLIGDVSIKAKKKE